MKKVEKQMEEEIDKVIQILRILKENQIDISKIVQNPQLTLGDVKNKDIEYLIMKNGWERNFFIGRAVRRILTFAERTIESRRFEKGEITPSQIKELQSLGLVSKSKKIVKPTAAENLIKILDKLETHIPGIASRLPKAVVRLGDIEEIRDILEKEDISPDTVIRISHVVTKAKSMLTGKKVDRIISPEIIKKMISYKLLSEEEVEKYRIEHEFKEEKGFSSKVEILIGILKKAKDNGISLDDLPTTHRTAKDIECLQPLVQQGEILETYDLGYYLGYVKLQMKAKLNGERSTLTDAQIDEFQKLGILNKYELEKYKKRLTATQELIIILKKLKSRGIELQQLLPYEVEIGQIEDIPGLEQIIEEEDINPKYKIGKRMNSVANTIKTILTENEHPEYKMMRKGELLKISEEEIEEVLALGFITDESMTRYQKSQNKKMNAYIIGQTVAQTYSGADETIINIMKQALAKHVEENPEAREMLINKLREQQLGDK